jgi:serine/threonine-protein kinase
VTDNNPLREGVSSGETVDNRYTVISRIGSGGMADVYLAEDKQLGRRIALKVLHRRFAADQEFVERFRREASSAAGLQHPNVVQVFDRGDIDGTYYIAMEYLDGRTLKHLVRDEGQLEPARAVDITIQILRAARFAHKRGIIHRDLKPHNVIVDSEGRVKVTDFGIARAGASDMTETGAIMGTAAYLSPEQAQGHAVSAQSDLYSIGILLYELLTGQVPFDAESAVTIALKQVSETPVPPRELNPAVSPELEDVVLKALQKDPANRFVDADEFVAALDDVRDMPARPDVGQRTGPLTGIYPALTGVTYGPEEAPRRRLWRWLGALLLVLLLAGGAAAAYVLTRPAQKVVPGVVRFRDDVAQTRLSNEGFKVEQLNVTNPARVGTVIKQSPAGGTKVDEGSVVTITVSQGPGTADVPDVAGMTLPQAMKALKDRGFRVDFVQVFSETVEKGRVVDTRPPGRTQLNKGSKVTIEVSRGPETAPVPDVVGKTEGAARALLGDAGFEVTTTKQESDTQTPGTVISSDPAARTVRPKGTTVTLTVAKAPKTFAVPSVEGLGVDRALRRLSAKGFRFAVQERTTTLPDEDGVVLSQDPAGGTKLQKGDSVTLVVGKFDDSSLNPEGSPTPTPTAVTPTPTVATPTPTVTTTP